MVRWGELQRERPDLVEAGRELFYQDFGVGLGYLATTSKSGAPRLHPICPSIADDSLYAFLIPSPKLEDLRRDARYAVHSLLTPRNEDAFYVTGTVRFVTDAGERMKLERAYAAERAWMEPSGFASQPAVEFLIERCLLTRTTGHGDPNPSHTVWKA